MIKSQRDLEDDNETAFLTRITEKYLSSEEFNGLPIDELGALDITRSALARLIESSSISLNFGDRHPNPHILAFEPEPKEEQLQKLTSLTFPEPDIRDFGVLKVNFNANHCCAYPTRSCLEQVVDKSPYDTRPYTLMLALGEPQLSYKSFNLRILEFYRNEPRYSYHTDDIHGSISVVSENTMDEADEVFLQSFGFSYKEDMKRRFVAVFLRDLANLNADHQQRWRIEQFSGKTFLHPDYLASSMGHWPEKESIFNAFCEELRLVSEMTTAAFGSSLFLKPFGYEQKPRELGFIFRPTRKEYDAFVHLLDKMLSDNISKKFFRGKVEMVTIEEKDGVRVERPKGTIQLLDEWLARSWKCPDPEPKEQMIATFKKIRAERSPQAHTVKENEFDESYIIKQRELMIDAYDAVRTLRLIFANHPKAKSVKVSDWLFKGEIRTF